MKEVLKRLEKSTWISQRKDGEQMRETLERWKTNKDRYCQQICKGFDSGLQSCLECPLYPIGQEIKEVLKP